MARKYTDADVKAYKRARQQLEAVGRRDKRAGRKHETSAFNRANSAVIKAEKQIPWWRR